MRTINNTLCSAEALSRWETKEFGLISPINFIGALEETRQIDKLDAYIFELICKDLRYKLDNNLEYVPISFNLSRLDFILMDPFQMVLDLTNKYDIPHRLIKIEITETIVMSCPGEIKNIMSKFKSEGFDIWMDDFGSAYSSLNMLKDFDFDEIKLDLVFLKNFNDKSKIIIKNVISMAKELGIQTLCEGVETEEQFTFLRSIGCEKVQGYFLSKPVPFHLMLDTIKEKQFEIEKPIFRDYFIPLSQIDFQTELPICLMNLSNNNCKIFYLNDRCKQNLSIAGIKDEKAFENKINSFDLTLIQKIKNLNSKSNFIHIINGHLFKISFSILSNYDKNSLYLLNIDSLDFKDIDKVTKLDSCLHEILEIFTSFVYLDFNNDSFDIVLDNEAYVLNNFTSLSSALESIKKHIYINDLKKYESLFNQERLKELFNKNKSPYLSQTIRLYNTNKEIVRINVIIVLISKTENKYLLITRNLTNDEEKMYSDLAKIFRAREDIVSVEKNEITSYDMFISIIKNSSSIYFFKDLNHRFLGGSDKFLDLIDENHVSNIIGYTDTELGISVSNNKLNNLETMVMKDKIEVKNEAVNFIKCGKLTDVTLNIFPICENKTIKGLFAEVITSNVEELISNKTLLNYHEFVDAYLKYYDQYKYHNEYFVTYKIELSKLDEVKKTLGIEFIKKVENEVSNILVKKYGKNVCIAHVGYGLFYLIKNYSDDSNTKKFKDELTHSIFDIKSVSGINVTIFNCIEYFICNQNSDVSIKNILKTLEV